MSNINLPREKFQEKIYKEFPKLYADVNKPAYQTSMCWGIDTGPGWYDLIYDLSAKLEKLITDLPQDQKDWDCKAAQVKEKFGGLRFYMTAETEEMSNLIREAENQSVQTCEQCGKPGQLIKAGWIYCACKDCVKEEHKNQFEEPKKENEQ